MTESPATQPPEQPPGSPPEEQAPTQPWQPLLRKAGKWWKQGIAASVGLAILVYLVTGRDGDLIAWTSERVAIYPSTRTHDLVLPLSMSQTPVKSLTFVQMQISNAGKSTIGRQDEPWILSIAGPPEATLVLLEEATRSSERLVVSPIKRSGSNELSMEVGSIHPREFFDLRFAVANASDASRPSFQVGTNLRGLPRPLQTDESPTERAVWKLLPWLWPALFAALMYEAVGFRHHPEKGPGMLRGVKDWRLRLAGHAVLAVVMSFAGGLGLAFVIGWIAVTSWQMGILP